MNDEVNKMDLMAMPTFLLELSLWKYLPIKLYYAGLGWHQLCRARGNTPFVGLSKIKQKNIMHL